MSIKNPILTAGSKEIQKEVHLTKIRLLQEKLSKLTILENPLEIQDICNRIIGIKKTLEKLPSRKEKHK